MVIQTYEGGLSGVRAANPNIQLSLGRDPQLVDEAVLVVRDPPTTDDPAGRDVWCDAENRDWSAGRAISFRIKPSHAFELSLSFMRRNRVAYTTWTDLEEGVWQTVRISFDDIRPNPYFQPPDARIGRPIDLSEVKGIAFAPHDQTSGELAIGRFVILR
jgi:Carbohydrate binding domain (family 11)